MSNTLPAPDFSRLAPRAGSRMVVAGGCGGIGKHVVAACVANNLRVAVLGSGSFSLEIGGPKINPGKRNAVPGGREYCGHAAGSCEARQGKIRSKSGCDMLHSEVLPLK